MLSIDLHHFRVQETKAAITHLFKTAFEQNAESVYIITGRGSHVNSNGSSGVLKKILPSLLKPYADKIEQTDIETGAYKITLKQQPTLRKQFIQELAETDLFDSFRLSLEQQAQTEGDETKVQLACLYLAFYATDPEKLKRAFDMLNTAEKNNYTIAGVILAELNLNGLYSQRNPEKGFKLLKIHAKHSNEAKFLLAKCYLQGEGVKQDDKTGAKLMKELADEGDAPACGNIGRSYIVGDFTAKNKTLGIQYLQKAADKGYSFAYVDLARCYGAGEGIEQNDQLALYYYTLAAKLDNLFAIHQLGNYHLSGRGVKADPQKAFQFFLKAAELGDVDSQGVMAIVCFMGIDIKTDIPQGLKWLKKAADQNEEKACYLMGEALLNGRITQQNIPNALKYFKVAVKSKHALAMFSLAFAILMQQYTQTDTKYAFDLLKQAFALKPKLTEYPLDILLTQQHFLLMNAFFNPSQKLIASIPEAEIFFVSFMLFYMGFLKNPMTYRPLLALELAEYVAEQGDQESQWFLVDVYLSGIEKDIPKNEARGMYWLEKLAQNNHTEALLKLAALYRDGLLGKTSANSTSSVSIQSPPPTQLPRITTTAIKTAEPQRSNSTATTETVNHHPNHWTWLNRYTITAVTTVATLAAAVMYQYKK